MEFGIEFGMDTSAILAKSAEVRDMSREIEGLTMNPPFGLRVIICWGRICIGALFPEPFWLPF